MKITIITPVFGVAGVPLAQIRFAKALLKQGHEVHLIFGFVDARFTIPAIDGVKVEIWQHRKVRAILFPLICYLRQENPDVIFSAEDHLNCITLLAAIF